MKEIVKRTITTLILGSLFWFDLTYLPPIYFSIALIAILIRIIFIEWRQLFELTNPLFWLLMPLYPILPFGMLIHLNHMPDHRFLLWILFIIVSSFDVGAYLVGNIIGYHKVAPTISPGKTWEGFAGGYISACIGLTWILWQLGRIPSAQVVIGLTSIICILSFAGDLFESWLKRRAHIKDTCSILPGHGGFLDRFDGIMFSTVFFYMLKDYLITLF